MVGSLWRGLGLVDVVIHLGYMVVAGVWELLVTTCCCAIIEGETILPARANLRVAGNAKSELRLRSENGQRSQE